MNDSNISFTTLSIRLLILPLLLQIEWRNNRLELQSESNVALIDELDKLLVLLQIPPEVGTESTYYYSALCPSMI